LNEPTSKPLPFSLIISHHLSSFCTFTHMTNLSEPKYYSGLHSDGKIITRIHGKYYDLTGFQHPGGPVALLHASGREATALFESYHPFTRDHAYAVLQKFEVEEGSFNKTNRFLETDLFGEDRFKWDVNKRSPFHQDLIDCAQKYFESEHIRRGLGSLPLTAATKATPFRLIEDTIYFILAWYCIYKMVTEQSWYYCLCVGFTSWLCVVNYWHEANHFGLSTDWRLNAYLPLLYPFFLSIVLWRHQVEPLYRILTTTHIFILLFVMYYRPICSCLSFLKKTIVFFFLYCSNFTTGKYICVHVINELTQLIDYWPKFLLIPIDFVCN